MTISDDQARILRWCSRADAKRIDHMNARTRNRYSLVASELIKRGHLDAVEDEFLVTLAGEQALCDYKDRKR